MTKQDFYQKVAEVTATPQERLTDTTSLDDIFDSLAVLNLILVSDKEWGRKISADTFEKCDILIDLVEALPDLVDPE